MTMLVSLAQAKLRLRYDTDDADSDLELAIAGASRMVMTYIGQHAEGFFDTYGDLVVDSAGVAENVPEDIQNATIYLAGWLVKNPDSDPDKDIELGYLPKPVIAMLYPYRTPTVA